MAAPIVFEAGYQRQSRAAIEHTLAHPGRSLSEPIFLQTGQLQNENANV